MDKVERAISYVLVAGIAFMLAFLYLPTVTAGSSTTTVISANWARFGSVHVDELNATSAGVIKSAGGAGPTIVTFTYPATASWNGTWTHNFNNAAVNNVGHSGNDFGATNTLVATTFSGAITTGTNIIFTGSTGQLLGPTLMRAKANDINFQVGAGDAAVLKIRAATSDIVLGGVINWHNSGSTGANTIILGANSPAGAGLAPATWIPITLANGTVVHVPAWK